MYTKTFYCRIPSENAPFSCIEDPTAFNRYVPEEDRDNWVQIEATLDYTINTFSLNKPIGIEQVDGEWTLQFDDTPMSIEEFRPLKAQTEIGNRKRRDMDLSLSDWTQMPDSPLSDEQKQVWAEYRKKLRDLSDQPGWPFQIEWPDYPIFSDSDEEA